MEGASARIRSFLGAEGLYDRFALEPAHPRELLLLETMTLRQFIEHGRSVRIQRINAPPSAAAGAITSALGSA
jgi:hypothetical protein